MSEAGRRSYDRDVDPIVETFVERVVGETRHLLRNEYTAAVVALGNKIDALADQVGDANLQSVQDHARVTAKIEDLDRSVKGLQPLKQRVTDLEGHDRADAAVAAAIDKMNRRLLGLAGLIVTAAGVLLGVLH